MQRYYVIDSPIYKRASRRSARFDEFPAKLSATVAPEKEKLGIT
jgi:hypothetical protein